MARQTIVSTQQAERITDRALRHIRPIFGKCYGYPMTHNTRIRPSLKARLRRGVDKLRYETGDRTISEASLTDKALEEYLDKHGL